jgi:hypothetical protein
VASRDKPEVFATKRVNHYKNLPSAPKAHCNEAFFSFSVGVWAMQRQRVIENTLRISKRHPVFLEVTPGLRGVILEVHDQEYAYCTYLSSIGDALTPQAEGQGRWKIGMKIGVRVKTAYK